MEDPSVKFTQYPNNEIKPFSIIFKSLLTKKDPDLNSCSTPSGYVCLEEQVMSRCKGDSKLHVAMVIRHLSLLRCVQTSWPYLWHRWGLYSHSEGGGGTRPLSRCGLAVRRQAGKQKDLGSIRFGCPFSSKFVVSGHCLETLPTQLMRHKNISHSCPP